MKKLLVISIMLLLLTGCSSSHKLIGAWVSDNDEIRFIDNKTMYYENKIMEYRTIDGKEIIYIKPDGDTLILNFEVNKNELILSYQGESVFFNRLTENEKNKRSLIATWYNIDDGFYFIDKDKITYKNGEVTYSVNNDTLTIKNSEGKLQKWKFSIKEDKLTLIIDNKELILQKSP